MGNGRNGAAGSAALIVIDVQNDFTTGSMAVPGAAQIIEPINRLAEAFELVVTVQDWHPNGHVSFASTHPGARHRDTVQLEHGPQRVFHDHCIQGTPGAELDPGLRLTKASLVLRKGCRRDVDSHSAFVENDGRTTTGLAGYLRARGVERLYCVGLTRYGCVMMSAVDAAREGFSVTIVDDACEDRDLGPKEAAEADRTLAALGIGRIDTDALLAATAISTSAPPR